MVSGNLEILWMAGKLERELDLRHGERRALAEEALGVPAGRVKALRAVVRWWPRFRDNVPIVAAGSTAEGSG